MNTKIPILLNSYFYKKNQISDRLKEFHEVLNKSDKRIFAELSFCICTPQSKAFTCWNAISKLMSNNILYYGSKEDINPFLRGIRFHNNKAKYIVEARNFFTEQGQLAIKNKIKSFNDPLKLRDWLIKNIKGIGMKEASHFLRNIGLGDDLAILDRHVIKNLKGLGVIQTVPKSLSKKRYLEIESKMKAFSQMIGIPIDALDLLLWSNETGSIYK